MVIEQKKKSQLRQKKATKKATNKVVRKATNQTQSSLTLKMSIVAFATFFV